METLRVFGHVYHLDCSAGIMGVSTGPNSLNCTH